MLGIVESRMHHRFYSSVLCVHDNRVPNQRDYYQKKNFRDAKTVRFTPTNIHSQRSDGRIAWAVRSELSSSAKALRNCARFNCFPFGRFIMFVAARVTLAFRINHLAKRDTGLGSPSILRRYVCISAGTCSPTGLSVKTRRDSTKARNFSRTVRVKNSRFCSKA